MLSRVIARPIHSFTRTLHIMTQNTDELAISESLSQVTLEGKDKTVVNDGQVLVSKGSGKLKVRKGQPEEEYQEQLRQFREGGPVINTLTWLEENDLSQIDKTKKSDRLKLENYAQRLYFQRKYKECLDVVKHGLELFADMPRKRVLSEWQDLEYMRDQCTAKLSTE